MRESFPGGARMSYEEKIEQHCADSAHLSELLAKHPHITYDLETVHNAIHWSNICVRWNALKSDPPTLVEVILSIQEDENRRRWFAHYIELWEEAVRRNALTPQGSTVVETLLPLNDLGIRKRLFAQQLKFIEKGQQVVPIRQTVGV